MKNAPGSLVLIPVPLSPAASLGENLLSCDVPRVQGLKHFLAENAKTARAFLKTLPLTQALQSLQIHEINKHSPTDGLDQALAPLLQGEDVGLMSEAGCPAVADAGAEAVAWAQRHMSKIEPLVGPSSLMLALMASGLNGQSFAFNGYLPQQSEARRAQLVKLQNRSKAERQTQLAIETPYRAKQFFEDALACLAPGTQMSVACDLRLSSQWCATKSIAQWHHEKNAADKLQGRLVVFSWLSSDNKVMHG